MRPQRTPAKAPRSRMPRAAGQTDPVEVCCRVRSLPADSDESCIEINSEHSLRMKSADGRAVDCQFSRIFDCHCDQEVLFENVARPMVDGMLKGKNGLLFTYGVTSSGKTYTMTGTVEHPGFLPRCLDMLFNSLEGVLAPKYSFMPDNMNGFIVQSVADAMMEKQERELMPRNTPVKTPSKSRGAVDLKYDIEYCRSENINPDVRYAVFISYVEIYNDYVYDLLEDVQYDHFSRSRPPQSKRLREDKKRNMFVYGVNEIEITTTEEAFSVFKKGQERRRIAHTQLNAESSRSHSIFNIRLVQAPLDPLGEDLLQDKSLVCVSQLSLVDLAGSERQSRTGAGGERVREAGNINSSLMTLRRCLEQLRDNQHGGNEMVKYRNAKITFLFKMFFEGSGQVKMVVCVNPSIHEYDENVHVMKFAETAQQVEVDRAEEVHLDKETVKRKMEEAKARAEEEKRREMNAARKLNGELSTNTLFQRGKKKCRRNLSVTSQSSDPDVETNELWVAPDLNLGPPLPNLELSDFADENTIPDLMVILAQRISKRKDILKTVHSMETHLRVNLLNNKEHDEDVQAKLIECQASLEEKSKDVSRMEKQIRKLEAKNQVLTKTTLVYESEKKGLNEHLAKTELQLKESQLDNRKLENRMRGAIANQKSQFEKQCERRVRNAQSQMQEKMWAKDERLRQLKSIMVESNSREGRPTTRRAALSNSTLPSAESGSGESSRPSKLTRKRRSRSADNLLSERTMNKSRRASNSSQDLCQTTPKGVKKTIANTGVTDPALPVAPKHTRGKSSGGNGWLAHHPTTTVSTGTIMQPCIKPGKIVSVPSPKDIKNADKYLLTHQKEDFEGEIETHLIKGDVIHTRSGGQQVQFVDIETLKQRDPHKSKTEPSPRKRKSSGDKSDDDQSSWTDVETRCSTAIEHKAGSGAGPVVFNHIKRRK